MTELTLDEKDVAPGPLAQFERWFELAAGDARIDKPEAACVSTADAEGRASGRMVLVKGWDDAGFVFYTNYDSRKAADLDGRGWASLLFWWDVFQRQVRLEGPIERVSAEVSDAYFDSRPRGSQLGAIASAQSEIVSSRADLEARFREIEAAHAGQPVPRPANWGGYRLVPEEVEFWQGRSDRFHDRVRYSKDGDGWQIHRLSP